MKLLLGAAAAAVLLAGPAFAQTAPATYYGNIGYSALSGGGEDDTTLNAITGRVGARFGQYVGVEGQASFGLGSEEFEGVDISLNNEFSGHLVGFLPVSPNADLLARIGYGRTELKGEIQGFEAEASGSGITFGVGGQYFFDGLNGVRLDYTRQEFSEDEDNEIQGGDVDTFTISYARRF